MKLQLIMTEPPIVVNDEKVKDEDYIWTSDFVRKTKEVFNDWVVSDNIDGTEEMTSYTNCKKIVAGLPNLPTIDFSSLSEEDCKKIGYVDVFALAENKYPLENALHMFSTNVIRTGFVEGFKLAQQMNDKKYSEEDILVDFCIKTFYSNPDPEGTDYDKCLIYARNYINSLKQPRVYDIEVEMEKVCRLEHSNERCIHCINGCDKDFEIPKITNNSIKITKIS